jgi:class 3 adenylate cyclase
MQMPGCEPLVDREGILIWRGLRIKVGMAWGMINSQKPLNTGRADYFGELANGAARVSVLAAPGQVGVGVQGGATERAQQAGPCASLQSVISTNYSFCCRSALLHCAGAV